MSLSARQIDKQAVPGLIGHGTDPRQQCREIGNKDEKEVNVLVSQS